MASASSKAHEEERTVVWVDESGFYPLPAVVRTWAPRGETPILHALLTRDHLSVISGLTPVGQLLMQVQERSLRAPDVVRFLRHLLRHIPGKLLVIWDRAPIHRAQAVKDFLAQGGAARLHLEQLPAYAPELNPDERRPSKDREIAAADAISGAYPRRTPGPSARRAVPPRGAAVSRAG